MKELLIRKENNRALVVLIKDNVRSAPHVDKEVKKTKKGLAVWRALQNNASEVSISQSLKG